jgi:hypothetical protein
MQGDLSHLSAIEQRAVIAYRDLVLERLPTHIRRLIVYGSRACGDAESDSDMDVAVIVEGHDQQTPEGWRPAPFSDPVWQAIVDSACDVSLEYDLYITPFVSTEDRLSEASPFQSNHGLYSIDVHVRGEEIVKQQLLARLINDFNQWEELLGNLSEAQLTKPRHPSRLSIKDEVAHLHAWQLLSIARLEAGLLNREPIPPDLPAEDPAMPDALDATNAHIYARYRDQPWSSVHHAWREGYLRFLELAEAIPETVLFDKGRFSWLEGYALADVLQGSYEHHDEHIDQLRAWLYQPGNIKSSE